MYDGSSLSVSTTFIVSLVDGQTLGNCGPVAQSPAAAGGTEGSSLCSTLLSSFDLARLDTKCPLKAYCQAPAKGRQQQQQEEGGGGMVSLRREPRMAFTKVGWVEIFFLCEILMLQNLIAIKVVAIMHTIQTLASLTRLIDDSKWLCNFNVTNFPAQ